MAELQHYQKRVLDKGDRPFALHGTGTGKTLTSLEFIKKSQDDHPDSNTVLITSAALKDNLAKEADKHGVDIDMDKVFTVTHESMSRAGSAEKVKELAKGGTLVIDEIHKIRNPKAKGYINTMEASQNARRALGLTGTAIVNDIDDLSNLYGLVQGNVRNPVRETYTRQAKEKLGFWDKIRGKEAKVRFEVHKPEYLRANFRHLDVYYPPKNDPNRPTVIEKVEEVDMTPVQVLAYKNAEKESIGGNPELETLAQKIRDGVELTNKEKARQNAFASQTTQAALSSAIHVKGTNSSGKIDKALEDLSGYFESNPRHRGVIYTNKIGAGVDSILEKMHERGMEDDVQVITGKTNKATIKEVVDNYNSGKKPILLISDSGAEGLDLEGTRSIQTMNPHFHDGKVTQAIGRGARFQSHSKLPKRERTVNVTHYHSKFPDNFIFKTPRTIDQHMHELSSKKASERDMVISVLS